MMTVTCVKVLGESFQVENTACAWPWGRSKHICEQSRERKERRLGGELW